MHRENAFSISIATIFQGFLHFEDQTLTLGSFSYVYYVLLYVMEEVLIVSGNDKQRKIYYERKEFTKALATATAYLKKLS